MSTQQPTQTPGGYLEGINIPRLILALHRLGCATEGLEATAAALAEYVNRLTQTVMSDKPQESPRIGCATGHVMTPIDAQPDGTVTTLTAAPCRPLTDEQIGKIYLDADDIEDSYAACEKFARAVVAEFCRANGIAPEGGAA